MNKLINGSIERRLIGMDCPFFCLSERCFNGTCFICSGEYLENQRERLRIQLGMDEG